MKRRKKTMEEWEIRKMETSRRRKRKEVAPTNSVAVVAVVVDGDYVAA